MYVCPILSQKCINIMNIVAPQLMDRETSSPSYFSTPPILTLPSDATCTHIHAYTHTCLHRDGQDQTATLLYHCQWRGVDLDISLSSLRPLHHSHCNLLLYPAPVPLAQAAVPSWCQGPPVSRMRAWAATMAPSVCAGSSVRMREPQGTAVLR